MLTGAFKVTSAATLLDIYGMVAGWYSEPSFLEIKANGPLPGRECPMLYD